MSTLVHNFGNEDKSYLSEIDLRNFLSTHFRGLQRLIRFYHFNEDHPQNHNIRPSANQSFIDVITNGEFVPVNKEYVLDTVILDAWKTLVEFYNKLELEGEIDDFRSTLISEETSERIDQFVETYKHVCDGKLESAHKELQNDIYEMIKYQSAQIAKKKRSSHYKPR